MRKLSVAAVIAVLLAAFAPAAQGDPSVLSIVRVTPATTADAAFLMSHFDETHNHGDGEIELLLWPGDALELDALGYDYRVVIPDLVAHDRARAGGPHPLVGLPGPDRDDYRRLGDYRDEMHALAEKNPSLVRLFEMPRASLEGRPVFGLEIASSVGRDDGRPVYYVDGLHHAREWPAAEYVMIFAHKLVEGFGKDPQVTSLLRRGRVIVVPVVNVDGFDYSRESALAANRTVDQQTWPIGLVNGFENYWRKNRRSLTGATAPGLQSNPDAYGVDPNRNYAYEWGDQEGGSSEIPLEQDYRGEAPFSEPETKNVRDIILGREVTGVITNHTVQATVLRAGGGFSPEDATLTAIGARLAEAAGYENRATVGYPTTGTTDDWAYAAIGAFGFTIEHGGSGFHPPYTEVGQLMPGVVEAFMTMGEIATNAKYHAVVAGRVVAGRAKLTLSRSFQTPLSEGNPLGKEAITEKVKLSLTTGRDGRFEWHVGPSTSPWERPRSDSYTLLIRAGGKTTKIEITLGRGQRIDLGAIKL
ncbi:MAG: M14 family zinc carboxypeptidase [Actinomycetota bacterium]